MKSNTKYFAIVGLLAATLLHSQPASATADPIKQQEGIKPGEQPVQKADTGLPATSGAELNMLVRDVATDTSKKYEEAFVPYIGSFHVRKIQSTGTHNQFDLVLERVAKTWSPDPSRAKESYTVSITGGGLEGVKFVNVSWWSFGLRSCILEMSCVGGSYSYPRILRNITLLEIKKPSTN